VIHDPSQARALFAIFAAGFTALATEMLLLYVRAWRLRRPLRLDARERVLTRGAITGWCLPIATGLLSLAIALTVPIRYIAWSGWVYFALIVMVRLHRRHVRKQAAAVPARDMPTDSDRTLTPGAS